MNMFLKMACNEDCDLLFKWANDKVVRENSFNSDEIKFDDHERWFYSKLNSELSKIFIFYFDNKPVGQVRIDIEGSEAIISYSIDKNYRGNGLSIKMLSLLEVNVKNNIYKLIGYVKNDNNVSQKAFEKLGYKKVQYDNYIKYYKII